jgi:hypothetical protein
MTGHLEMFRSISKVMEDPSIGEDTKNILSKARSMITNQNSLIASLQYKMSIAEMGQTLNIQRALEITCAKPVLNPDVATKLYHIPTTDQYLTLPEVYQLARDLTTKI